MTFTLEPTRTRTERAEPAAAVPVEAVPVQTAQVDQRDADEVVPAPVRTLTWPVEADPVERAVERAAKPARTRTVFTRMMGLRTAAISYLAFWLTTLVQPAPDGSAPVMLWWATALTYGSLILLAGSWLLLVAGRRTGLTSALLGGAAWLGLTASCPAMDHHEIAAWWFVQLAASLLIMGMSAVLLVRTKRA
jgi:hypothetical protein